MFISEKIIFLTITKPGYSRSWTYFNGIKKLGFDADFIKIDSRNLIKEFVRIKKRVSRNNIFVVMSPSQYLVPFVRLFFGKKVYLDAGWSLFEATIISRKQFGLFGWLALKNYLIDWTASLLAQKIILESKLQKNFYTKLFLVPRRKCYVLYTGVDEESFQVNRFFVKPPDFFNNSKIVLFRGKFNPEAGIEILAEATRLLSNEQITFWVFCPGLPNNVKFSQNTFVSREFLPNGDIPGLIASSSISLGQLAKHNRLIRTIPHKAFESAYLAKPYISARNKGIAEIFDEGREVLLFTPGNSMELANEIKRLTNNQALAMKLSQSIFEKYNRNLSQKILAKEFLKVLSLEGKIPLTSL